MDNNYGKNARVLFVFDVSAEYRVIRTVAGIGLHCKECDMISYNKNDIKNKYCGNCYKYLL